MPFWRAPGPDDESQRYILAEINRAQETLDEAIAEARRLPTSDLSRSARLTRYNQLKRQVDRTYANLINSAYDWSRDEVPVLYAEGHLAAAYQLEAGIDFTLIHQEAVDTVVNDAFDDVARGLKQVPTNFSDKINAQITLERLSVSKRDLIKVSAKGWVGQQLLLGELSPAEAARKLADDLWIGGVTIIDRAGRQWNPKSYSRMLVRTKSAEAFNVGSLNKMTEEGVGRVKVFDGEEDDEICRRANGQVWSMKFAQDHIIAHPNCRRAFGPMPGKGPVHRATVSEVARIGTAAVADEVLISGVIREIREWKSRGQVVLIEDEILERLDELRFFEEIRFAERIKHLEEELTEILDPIIHFERTFDDVEELPEIQRLAHRRLVGHAIDSKPDDLGPLFKINPDFGGLPAEPDQRAIELMAEEILDNINNIRQSEGGQFGLRQFFDEWYEAVEQTLEDGIELPVITDLWETFSKLRTKVLSGERLTAQEIHELRRMKSTVSVMPTLPERWIEQDIALIGWIEESFDRMVDALEVGEHTASHVGGVTFNNVMDVLKDVFGRRIETWSYGGQNAGYGVIDEKFFIKRIGLVGSYSYNVAAQERWVSRVMRAFGTHTDDSVVIFPFDDHHKGLLITQAHRQVDGWSDMRSVGLASDSIPRNKQRRLVLMNLITMENDGHSGNYMILGAGGQTPKKADDVVDVVSIDHELSIGWPGRRGQIKSTGFGAVSYEAWRRRVNDGMDANLSGYLDGISGPKVEPVKIPEEKYDLIKSQLSTGTDTVWMVGGRNIVIDGVPYNESHIFEFFPPNHKGWLAPGYLGFYQDAANTRITRTIYLNPDEALWVRRFIYGEFDLEFSRDLRDAYHYMDQPQRDKLISSWRHQYGLDDSLKYDDVIQEVADINLDRMKIHLERLIEGGTINLNKNVTSWGDFAVHRTVTLGQETRFPLKSGEEIRGVVIQLITLPTPQGTIRRGAMVVSGINDSSTLQLRMVWEADVAERRLLGLRPSKNLITRFTQKISRKVQAPGVTLRPVYNDLGIIESFVEFPLEPVFDELLEETWGTWATNAAKSDALQERFAREVMSEVDTIPAQLRPERVKIVNDLPAGIAGMFVPSRSAALELKAMYGIDVQEGDLLIRMAEVNPNLLEKVWSTAGVIAPSGQRAINEALDHVDWTKIRAVVRHELGHSIRHTQERNVRQLALADAIETLRKQGRDLSAGADADTINAINQIADEAVILWRRRWQLNAQRYMELELRLGKPGDGNVNEALNAPDWTRYPAYAYTKGKVKTTSGDLEVDWAEELAGEIWERILAGEVPDVPPALLADLLTLDPPPMSDPSRIPRWSRLTKQKFDTSSTNLLLKANMDDGTQDLAKQLREALDKKSDDLLALDGLEVYPDSTLKVQDSDVGFMRFKIIDEFGDETVPVGYLAIKKGKLIVERYTTGTDADTPLREATGYGFLKIVEALAAALGIREIEIGIKELHKPMIELGYRLPWTTKNAEVIEDMFTRISGKLKQFTIQAQLWDRHLTKTYDEDFMELWLNYLKDHDLELWNVLYPALKINDVRKGFLPIDITVSEAARMTYLRKVARSSVPKNSQWLLDIMSVGLFPRDTRWRNLITNSIENSTSMTPEDIRELNDLIHVLSERAYVHWDQVNRVIQPHRLQPADYAPILRLRATIAVIDADAHHFDAEWLHRFDMHFFGVDIDDEVINKLNDIELAYERGIISHADRVDETKLLWDDLVYKDLSSYPDIGSMSETERLMDDVRTWADLVRDPRYMAETVPSAWVDFSIDEVEDTFETYMRSIPDHTNPIQYHIIKTDDPVELMVDDIIWRSQRLRYRSDFVASSFVWSNLMPTVKRAIADDYLKSEADGLIRIYHYGMVSPEVEIGANVAIREPWIGYFVVTPLDSVRKRLMPTEVDALEPWWASGKIIMPDSENGLQYPFVFDDLRSVFKAVPPGIMDRSVGSFQYIDHRQRESFQNYIGSGYRSINDFLRGKNKQTRRAIDVFNIDRMLAAPEQDLPSAHELVERSNFGMLWRATGKHKGNINRVEWFRSNIGNEYVDFGFGSTSFSRATASSFGDMMMAIDMSPLPHVGRLVRRDGEWEVLLPRGIVYEIVDVRTVIWSEVSEEQARLLKIEPWDKLPDAIKRTARHGQAKTVVFLRAVDMLQPDEWVHYDLPPPDTGLHSLSIWKVEVGEYVKIYTKWAGVDDVLIHQGLVKQIDDASIHIEEPDGTTRRLFFTQWNTAIRVERAGQVPSIISPTGTVAIPEGKTTELKTFTFKLEHKKTLGFKDEDLVDLELMNEMFIGNEENLVDVWFLKKNGEWELHLQGGEIAPWDLDALADQGKELNEVGDLPLRIFPTEWATENPMIFDLNNPPAGVMKIFIVRYDAQPIESKIFFFKAPSFFTEEQAVFWKQAQNFVADAGAVDSNANQVMKLLNELQLGHKLTQAEVTALDNAWHSIEFESSKYYPLEWASEDFDLNTRWAHLIQTLQANLAPTPVPRYQTKGFEVTFTQLTQMSTAPASPGLKFRLFWVHTKGNQVVHEELIPPGTIKFASYSDVQVEPGQFWLHGTPGKSVVKSGYFVYNGLDGKEVYVSLLELKKFPGDIVFRLGDDVESAGDRLKSILEVMPWNFNTKLPYDVWLEVDGKAGWVINVKPTEVQLHGGQMIKFSDIKDVTMFIKPPPKIGDWITFKVIQKGDLNTYEVSGKLHEISSYFGPIHWTIVDKDGIIAAYPMHENAPLAVLDVVVHPPPSSVLPIKDGVILDQPYEDFAALLGKSGKHVIDFPPGSVWVSFEGVYSDQHLPVVFEGWVASISPNGEVLFENAGTKFNYKSAKSGTFTFFPAKSKIQGLPPDVPSVPMTSEGDLYPDDVKLVISYIFDYMKASPIPGNAQNFDWIEMWFHQALSWASIKLGWKDSLVWRQTFWDVFVSKVLPPDPQDLILGEGDIGELMVSMAHLYGHGLYIDNKFVTGLGSLDMDLSAKATRLLKKDDSPYKLWSAILRPEAYSSINEYLFPTAWHWVPDQKGKFIQWWQIVNTGYAALKNAGFPVGGSGIDHLADMHDYFIETLVVYFNKQKITWKDDYAEELWEAFKMIADEAGIDLSSTTVTETLIRLGWAMGIPKLGEVF